MSTNIISLLEDDIPEFLKSSPYLLSLITDEVFPSGGIEVPADCIKTNTQVENTSDLECLLKTVRYWLLPDLLVDLLDLHVFVFDPKNEADVVQVLDDFKIELTYLNTLLSLLPCGMQEKLIFAAGRGFVELLDYLCQMETTLEGVDQPIDWQRVIHTAATEGKLSCLKFLRAKEYRWEDDSLNVTLENGHLDCLIFMVDECEAEGEILHENTLYLVAATGGHITILDYLYKKFGYPQESTQLLVYCSAATTGNLEAMDFLDTHGFTTTSKDVFSASAEKGHVHVLKYLIKKFGVPDNEEVHRAFKQAARLGQLKVLRFLHEHVSPLTFTDEDVEVRIQGSLAVMCCALESGSIPCVAYLRELGHPWDSGFTRFASKQKESDLFWYLLEQGCPCIEEEASWTFAAKGSLKDLMLCRDKKLLWGAGTCEWAADLGHLECFQFLVENGCPINYEEICESAVGDINCLTYAHKLGGKLTPAVAVQAARCGAIECLQYLRANGCTFTVDVANAAASCQQKSLQFELLQFLLDAGCPVNEETCIHAATRPSCSGPNSTAEAQLACLKLLHERGCPWDESTCIAAADSEFLAGLKYAVEHGCPWGKKTRAAASRSDSIAGLKYAMEHGHMWDDETSAAAKHNCMAYLDRLTSSLKRKRSTDSGTDESDSINVGISE